MSLKVKAIKGFSWTAFEGIFSQGALFIVGILLARVLTPEDFGIIGIIGALIAISSSIVEGGFTSAVIRKVDADDYDYNTVFYTNLSIGILLYILLFCFSKEIAGFFEIPILSEIIKYSGLVLIFNAISIIQKIILSKILDFKTQAIVSIIASILGGIAALIMAYNDYGVWSLVVLAISRPLINSILLWSQTKWYPSIKFSKKSFNEFFNYGYKLLVANLINTAYKNVYYVLIGKFFSPASLGFYTRANQFQTPLSANITFAIRRISFPILSTLQDDPERLKNIFIKFLRFSIFLNFILLSFLAAMAKPIVLLLIGEKWNESILYLQLLCIPGMLYPLQILHLNLLLVKGYSHLNLKMEIIKKIILVPLIYITVLFGIEEMLYGLIFFSITEYFINSYYTNRLIGYSIKNQIKDILPFLFMSSFIAGIMFIVSFMNLDLKSMLIIQVLIGLFLFILINEVTKLNEYIELKHRGFYLLQKIKTYVK